MSTTLGQFKVYERIRLSGATNMFDVNKVIELSNGELDKETCLDIMKNYGKYYERLSSIEDDMKGELNQEEREQTWVGDEE